MTDWRRRLRNFFIVIAALVGVGSAVGVAVKLDRDATSCVRRASLTLSAEMASGVSPGVAEAAYRDAAMRCREHQDRTGDHSFSHFSLTSGYLAR